jgi:diguanylate cyclase (GGDEF)-like protein/PAS domain S-box-containing protein
MTDPDQSELPSESPRAASAEKAILFPASFGTAKRFFTALSDSIGSLTAYVDTDERLGYVCSHNAAWFGQPPEQLVGKTLLEAYGPQAYAEFSPWVRRALGGEPVHYERRATKPDGTAFWISVNLRPYRDASGKVLGVFSAALEVQDLKRTHDALDQALQELDFHMENSPLAMIEWSGDITVRRWSRQAQAIFGWREDEVIGKKSAELGLVHADSFETIQDVMRELTEGRARRNRMLTRNMTKDGRVIYCEWYNSAFTNSDGLITSILSLAQDVTLRIEAEEQLRDVAVNDALTGLPNRLSFTARLENSIARARRSGEPLALLFVDLDKFKRVNDTHGHAAGDEMLMQVAQRLKACVREVDAVARLGGDEFVVLLETDVRPETPEFIALRIRNAFAEGFNLPGMKLQCSASIGISRFPGDAQDAARLLASADEAMYREKQPV